MDFSAKTLQARREWKQIFKLLKERNYQPRIIYLAKLSFKYEREIKTFPDIENLEEFITKRPPLQEILKRVILPETTNRRLQNREYNHQHTYCIKRDNLWQQKH